MTTQNVNKLVIFEGPDGSGKSKHSKEIKKKLNEVHRGILHFEHEYKKGFFISRMNHLRSQRDELISLMCFMRRLKISPNIVIADRWNVSNLIYHQSENFLKRKYSESMYKEEEKRDQESGIGRIHVFLKPTIEDVKKRFEKRGEEFSKKDSQNQENYCAFFENISKEVNPKNIYLQFETKDDFEKTNQKILEEILKNLYL